MKENKKSSTVKNSILVVLCVLVACVIGYILILDRSHKNEIRNGINQNKEHAVMDGSAAKSRYLFINEISYDGKVELYNAGSNAVSLEHMTVVVGDAAVAIESSVIEAKAYYVVDVKHTFTEKYQKVSIVNFDGEIITSVQVPSLLEDESYGAITDGRNNMRYLKATLGETNDGAALVKKNFLYFSAMPGFYKDAFQLELVAPEDCTVYYTLNSDEPTVEATQYDGSIEIKNASGRGFSYADIVANINENQSIDMGTVVRAIAVDETGKVISEATATYWVGMEEDAEYSDIPIISLITDSDNLFDYHTGIYVTGRDLEDAKVAGDSVAGRGNYYKDETRPVYLEYFDLEKGIAYAGTAAVSTIKDKNITDAQKSLAISGLQDITKDSELGQYVEGKNGVLSLTNYGLDPQYKLRPLVVASLLKDDTAWNKRVSPVMVFLDGEFWGLYLMETQNSAEDICAQYEVKDIVTVTDSGISDEAYLSEYEELLQYITKNDMSDSNCYAYVKTKIDLEQYAEYICVNMYLGNTRYGSNNAVMWKTKQRGTTKYSDTKWHFAYGDMSAGMNNGWADLSTPSSNTFKIKAVDDNILMSSLVQNDEFKQLLREAMQTLMTETFAYDKVENVVLSTVDTVKKAVASSNARYRVNIDEKGVKQEGSKICEFFSERNQYISLYLEEFLSKEKIVREE